MNSADELLSDDERPPFQLTRRAPTDEVAADKSNPPAAQTEDVSADTWFDIRVGRDVKETLWTSPAPCNAWTAICCLLPHLVVVPTALRSIPNSRASILTRLAIAAFVGLIVFLICYDPPHFGIWGELVFTYPLLMVLMCVVRRGVRSHQVKLAASKGRSPAGQWDMEERMDEAAADCMNSTCCLSCGAIQTFFHLGSARYKGDDAPKQAPPDEGAPPTSEEIESLQAQVGSVIELREQRQAAAAIAMSSQALVVFFCYDSHARHLDRVSQLYTELAHKYPSTPFFRVQGMPDRLQPKKRDVVVDGMMRVVIELPELRLCVLNERKEVDAVEVTESWYRKHAAKKDAGFSPVNGEAELKAMLDYALARNITSPTILAPTFQFAQTTRDGRPVKDAPLGVEGLRARMGHVVNLRLQADWDAAMQLSHEVLVLVEFTGGWCGPSEIMAPLCAELAASNPTMPYLTVEVPIGFHQDRDLPDEAQWKQPLTLAHGVRSIPAFLLFWQGDIVSQTGGGAALENLDAAAESKWRVQFMIDQANKAKFMQRGH